MDVVWYYFVFNRLTLIEKLLTRTIRKEVVLKGKLIHHIRTMLKVNPNFVKDLVRSSIPLRSCRISLELHPLSCRSSRSLLMVDISRYALFSLAVP